MRDREWALGPGCRVKGGTAKPLLARKAVLLAGGEEQ